VSSQSPTYADFWLEKEKYSNYIDSSNDNPDQAFSIDLIQLASVRRIVSNYVDILTGTSVPVYFKAMGDSYNVGGQEIYITTAIKKKKDFDNAVGLALHEAAHTVLTDFDLAKIIPFNTPKSIWDFAKKNNIRKATMERFLKTMHNIVEDWYIDDWVINKAPGYTGYYEASYNVCFNTSTIDQILISNEYKYPSLASYEFRIINFCNPLTDLNALPGLEEIAKTVDISNISRLDTTKKRIECAFSVVEIVLKNIQKFHDNTNPQTAPQKKAGRINPLDFFKPHSDGNVSESGSKEDYDGSEEEQPFKPQKSDSERTIQDIADGLAERPKQPDDENKSMTEQGTKTPDRPVPKQIQEAVTEQVQYVHGHTKKDELNAIQKTMLDLIEKHGIVLVYVPIMMEGNDAAMKVGCIVVKKLTMELITSGQLVFPMANFWKDGNGTPTADPDMADAMKKGIAIGSKLGKKLLVRREIYRSRQIRKRSGTINRRLLYSAGFDAEDIFEKIRVIQWSKGSLHITVDASTSMSGKKWIDTMIMTVAICKATSMVDNIHVTVSFRATKDASGITMPYIVLAYDSKVDKFSKVKNLFGFLKPCGCTPEGLAYGAIMDLFTQASPDEEDRYFLNISDGEPCFSMKSPLTGHTISYGDGNGVEHTKNQVAKIRRQGIHILSYYVSGSTCNVLSTGHNTKRNFQTMYGKDARFIRSDNVVELAKTINELFLKGR
jgi:hypothetical protein